MHKHFTVLISLVLSVLVPFLPYESATATALASHPGRFAKALSEKDLASAVEALQAAVEAVGYEATLKPPSVAKGQEHEVLLVGRFGATSPGDG